MSPLSFEPYNLKVIKFKNGDIELKVYDKQIAPLTEEENAKRQAKRKHTIKEREDVENDYFEESYNPFTDSVELMEDIDEKKHLDFVKQKRKEKNARDSYRRTVNKIHDIARSENWTAFYTLTFSPDVVDRTDLQACMKKARKWFNNQKNRYCNDLKYLIIPERHKDGVSWHIHGLVADDCGINYVDSGHKTKNGKTIYNVSGWKNGFSTAVKIGETEEDNTKKIASYILKYITKEVCEKAVGGRVYYRSNNIRLPESETYNIDWENIVQSEYLDMLLISLGCEEVNRIKKVSSEYCSVTYINASL